LTVLFADIDDFKQYNDKFGHQEGDYVLQKVAEVITGEARGEDLASRYGGEEFTLLLGCDFDTAATVAERLRMSIADRCSKLADPQMKRDVTVSIGIASYGHDSTEADKLVKIADSRMYMAKARGKNQIYTGDVQLQVAGDEIIPAAEPEPNLGTDLGATGS
jgi:diguanylate cyclase (GGDEF)-like protein